MGQVRNGSFPGEEMNPKIGEIFLIESTVKQKGVGTSLIKDALNLMVENGSDSVVMTIPKTADGKAFVQSLIKKGLISDAIKTAESGTTLHNIQQAHTEQGVQQGKETQVKRKLNASDKAVNTFTPDQITKIKALLSKIEI
jgi:hypothetical protein